MKNIITASMAACCIFSLSATDMEFTYNSRGENPHGFGYSKAQAYDIGIVLNSPQLTGKQITGFSVPVYNSGSLGDVRAWLSKELTASKVDESVFTPDIACYDAQVEDGVLAFTFPEPYTIPEEGVFVGYSFNVAEVPAGGTFAPVSVADGTTPGGLWIHASSSQKKWADLTGRNNIVSAMTVSLAGAFSEGASSVGILADRVYAARNEASTVEVSLTNWGTEGISSVDYLYTVGGVEHTGTFKLEPPVPPVLGRMANALLDIAPVADLGEIELSLLITKVNGHDNGCSDALANCLLEVRPFVARYRPLVEEYTGLSCGWCPRGYVMMEQMKYYHGLDFVGLAYHTYGNDPMCCCTDAPFTPNGYPAATLNRGGSVDPSNIPSMWEKTINNVSPAEIEVSLEWADEEHTKMVATSRTRFVGDIEGSKYLVSYAVLADGLSNPDWFQYNGYADKDPSQPEYQTPFWDLFVGKGKYVGGLTFNDVVMYYPNVKGVEGSLPEVIEGEKWYEHIFEFGVDDLVNYTGTNVIDDYNKVRVVAAVVNSDNGKPLNCVSSVYPDGKAPELAVDAVVADAEVVDTSFFDLQGRRVGSPVGGLFIRVDRLADGSTRSSKVLLR